MQLADFEASKGAEITNCLIDLLAGGSPASVWNHANLQFPPVTRKSKVAS